jgi:hypothetical protein
VVLIDTVTDATTGGCTVTLIAALPTLPALLAEIATVPAPTAVTRPDDDTVATPASDDDQATVWPLSGLPNESLTTAVPCVTWPTWSELAFIVTVTENAVGG